MFNNSHKNLCDWLRLFSLRVSDPVWTDIGQVMTSQNEYICIVFQHYDKYILLIFLIEFYIILDSTFSLPLLHIISTVLTYGNK